MKVSVVFRDGGEETFDNVEAIDPIGLPGFISVVQHDNEDSDRHTSYVWPSVSIDNMIIETVEGEEFEHSGTPKWFKQV